MASHQEQIYYFCLKSCQECSVENHAICLYTVFNMQTSKSPKQTARVAYAAAKQILPAYSHKFSPKKFTQPQLVTCLVLKEFFTTDYRGITAILEDSSDLRKVLELTAVPHFTTLQKAARNLLTKKKMQKLMAGILQTATEHKLMRTTIQLAALDGTGFESHHVSTYFVQRKDRTAKEGYQTTQYTRFPKVGIVCDTGNHLVICGIPERGPRFDRTHFRSALKAAVQQKRIKNLAADAGYDGEANHVHARGTYDIRTIIPPTIGRRSEALPRTKYRKLMRTRFPQQLYGQRWQVETVMSMLKRNLGSALRARTYWSQCREIMLRLFTHNVMIVLPA